MTVEEFRDIIRYNEPYFVYRGRTYSICHHDGRFYVRRDDWPVNEDLAFQNVDDLLEHWMIEGRPLKDVLPETEP